MSNAKHAATYRAKQLAKSTAMAKRVEELEVICRMVLAASMFDTRPSRGESSIGWQKGDEGDAMTIRYAARKALEGSAKP